MGNKLVLSCLLLSSWFATGCAHMHAVQGIEKQSEIPDGIRVSIGSQEVKEGDKVDVLKQVCKSGGSGRGRSKSCTDKKMGEAKVLKVLDHDSAIVEPDPGVILEAGMKVEKKDLE